MSEMDLDTIKTPYPPFHATQMAGISAKVLTDLKLKQTNDQTNKTNKQNQTKSLSSLVSFSFSQPCGNASFLSVVGGENE